MTHNLIRTAGLRNEATMPNDFGVLTGFAARCSFGFADRHVQAKGRREHSGIGKSWVGYFKAIRQIAVVIAAAMLMGGCFQPLYGERPETGGQSLRDVLSSVEIPAIVAPNGTPESRLAVSLRNSLLFDFTGGAGSVAPTHRLNIALSAGWTTIIVDLTSGRANAEVEVVTATYSLSEIATGKAVLSDSTSSEVTYDVPGSQQRYARRRAQRDAEDRALKVVSDSIRARIASFFVAGT